MCSFRRTKNEDTDRKEKVEGQEWERGLDDEL